MSTESEVGSKQQIGNDPNAEALEVQIEIHENRATEQDIMATNSSTSTEDLQQSNNGESIPSPKRTTTIELTPAPSTEIPVNDDEDDEDDYVQKKEEVKNFDYNAHLYQHPGPNTSNLPKPPKSNDGDDDDDDHDHDDNDNKTESDPANCLCFEMKHIQQDFKGNNPILCNRLFLCGTDICTYITTFILMNIPGIFFYWAQIAYLPQHGIAFFVLCLLLSFIWYYIIYICSNIYIYMIHINIYIAILCVVFF